MLHSRANHTMRSVRVASLVLAGGLLSVPALAQPIIIPLSPAGEERAEAAAALARSRRPSAGKQSGRPERRGPLGSRHVRRRRERFGEPARRRSPARPDRRIENRPVNAALYRGSESGERTCPAARSTRSGQERPSGTPGQCGRPSTDTQIESRSAGHHRHDQNEAPGSDRAVQPRRPRPAGGGAAVPAQPVPRPGHPAGAVLRPPAAGADHRAAAAEAGPGELRPARRQVAAARGDRGAGPRARGGAARTRRTLLHRHALLAPVQRRSRPRRAGLQAGRGAAPAALPALLHDHDRQLAHRLARGSGARRAGRADDDALLLPLRPGLRRGDGGDRAGALRSRPRRPRSRDPAPGAVLRARPAGGDRQEGRPLPVPDRAHDRAGAAGLGPPRARRRHLLPVAGDAAGLARPEHRFRDRARGARQGGAAGRADRLRLRAFRDARGAGRRVPPPCGEARRAGLFPRPDPERGSRASSPRSPASCARRGGTGRACAASPAAAPARARMATARTPAPARRRPRRTTPLRRTPARIPVAA